MWNSDDLFNFLNLILLIESNHAAKQPDIATIIGDSPKAVSTARKGVEQHMEPMQQKEQRKQQPQTTDTSFFKNDHERGSHPLLISHILPPKQPGCLSPLFINLFYK